MKQEPARVLAAKVGLEQYDVESAVDIARETLFDTARDLTRFVPAASVR